MNCLTVFASFPNFKSFMCAQKEANLKDTEAKMTQVVQSNALHQQLLQHVLNQSDLDAYNFITMNPPDEGEPRLIRPDNRASRQHISFVVFFPS